MTLQGKLVKHDAAGKANDLTNGLSDPETSASPALPDQSFFSEPGVKSICRVEQTINEEFF
jgi:hypothetical protein